MHAVRQPLEGFFISRPGGTPASSRGSVRASVPRGGEERVFISCRDSPVWLRP